MADRILFSNFAISTLASGITDVAVTLNVASGAGVKFSSPAAGQYVMATLFDTAGNKEVIKVTARSTDQLTIARAQEGTAARAWNSGDGIIQVPTAGVLDMVSQKRDLDYLTAGGTGDAITLTPDPAFGAYEATKKIRFRVTAANTAAVAVNVSGLGVRGLKNLSGADLGAGELFVGRIVEAYDNGTEYRIVTDGAGGVWPGYIRNIGYAVSVATKALTVARKTQALTDPSVAGSSPVEIAFRNRTETVGDSVLRAITAAHSIVAPNGATLGFAPILRTITMTIASPCVVTDAAHGRLANDTVIFTTTGALPTGLTAGAVYFVRAPTTNAYEVSATAGGAAINTSGSQSGVHTASYAEKGSIYIYECDNGTIRETGLCKLALFDESRLYSTTAISATADSDNVLYTTTAMTDAAVRLTGRVDITAGAVAGEWDNEDTRIALGPKTIGFGTLAEFNAALSDGDFVTSRGSQLFTADGNFTVPGGITSIMLTGVAGGGGGGGAYGGSLGGGGGGSGTSIMAFRLDVTPGDVYAVVIGGGGAGGIGGDPGPSYAGSGGNTTFGATLLILGGGGGGAKGNIAGGAGGGGGTPITPSVFRHNSHNGVGGGVGDVTAPGGGLGGASFYGTNGKPATGYGAAGDGGAVTNGTGGNGAGGFLMVEW